jgi:hypothetical protein
MSARVPVWSLLVLALTLPAAAQPAPQYPPGTYQQAQPAPYQPTPYPQPQPAPSPVQPVQPMQPQPYPQPYPQPMGPQPSAADPGYGPPPPAYPGYGPPPPPPDALVSSVAGALQLNLGTYLVRYRSSSIDVDNNGGEFSQSSLKWGIGDEAPVTLEIGYGLTDNIVIGGLLQLGGTSDTQEAEATGAKAEASTFGITLTPKFDYNFLPTSKINPFVGAALGFALSSSDSDGTEVSTTMFVAFARAGLRCFLFEGFSVDPALVFGFGVGGGSQEAMGAKAEYGQNASQIGLALSTSGWLK